LRTGMCIRIPPGVRHRAIGTMKIINFVIPKFDPADEHFD
jgi:mannose-6-phosphate isomerase-like protein (cupin superfamily)